MSAHTREDLDRESRRARREFSHAHMSDTKWRKLFKALVSEEFRPRQMIVKFIGAPERRLMSFPSENGLRCPHAYIDTFEFGPVELRSIEWMLIPREAAFPKGPGIAPVRIPHDLPAIQAAISGLGHYPATEVDEGLQILGYSN